MQSQIKEAVKMTLYKDFFLACGLKPLFLLSSIAEFYWTVVIGDDWRHCCIVEQELLNVPYLCWLFLS